MTPQTIIGRTDAAIAGYGQIVTLQRTAVDPATGAISVSLSVDMPAVVRSTAPQDLLSGETTDIRVVLSPTHLGAFGVPSRDDRLIVGGDPTNIETIGPLYYGGRLVRINLLCRG